MNLEMRQEIQKAKKIIEDAIEGDKELKERYVYDVQLLLFDYGFSDYKQRQAAAEAIVNLIFY